ncbi:hypothetical protein K7432_007213 [Basidiobolus ranarum]|uniref:SMP-30/Gluconolactonase/LRE-like region domain-containing protein n=1 Tax=Basidiobolus ranarum TaxID=34480 RepID=A0ABR2W0G1_9FUNG
MREFSSLWILLTVAALTVVAKSSSNTKVVEIGNRFNVLPEPFSRTLDQSFFQTEVNSKLLEHLRDAAFFVYDKRFYDIIGTQPKLTLVAERDFPFAHEGGIYVPQTKEIMFTSGQMGLETEPYTEIFKMNIKTFEVTKVSPSLHIPLANGGTFHDGKAIFVSQGEGSIGGAIYSIDPVTYEAKLLLNNYFGLKFNSLNDIVVSRKDGSFWFTDPGYGYEQGFREKPQLGDFVYRWDPKTGDVRLAADGFIKPNGLQFSPDEKILYISDTGFITGVGGIDVKQPHTIYAYDVSRHKGGAFLTNRRVFAMTDNGIPDGIKLDDKGNLFVAVGDGINIYSPQGSLLGKINTALCSNLVFAKDDLFILSDTKIYHTRLNVQGVQFD